MAEHGTPEDVARWAAAMRGQDIPSKAERNRALVESIHPPDPQPEPEPADTQTPEQDHNELISGLFAPKGWQAELVRRLHGTGEE